MRHAVTAGWLGGMIIILACLPLPAAFAPPLAAAGAVLAWRRWGKGMLAGLKTALHLRRLLKRAVKTGGAVERA